MVEEDEEDGNIYAVLLPKSYSYNLCLTLVPQKCFSTFCKKNEFVFGTSDEENVAVQFFQLNSHAVTLTFSFDIPCMVMRSQQANHDLQLSATFMRTILYTISLHVPVSLSSCNFTWPHLILSATAFRDSILLLFKLPNLWC